MVEFEERTTQDASREIARTDRVAMEAELRRFRRRLAFWKDRLARLGAADRGETKPPSG
jgi:hypothetical protein